MRPFIKLCRRQCNLVKSPGSNLRLISSDHEQPKTHTEPSATIPLTIVKPKTHTEPSATIPLTIVKPSANWNWVPPRKVEKESSTNDGDIPIIKKYV